MTQRGDLVRVSLPGDDGKPRPALVVQSDRLEKLFEMYMKMTGVKTGQANPEQGSA